MKIYIVTYCDKLEDREVIVSYHRTHKGAKKRLKQEIKKNNFIYDIQKEILED